MRHDEKGGGLALWLVGRLVGSWPAGRTCGHILPKHESVGWPPPQASTHAPGLELVLRLCAWIILPPSPSTHVSMGSFAHTPPPHTHGRSCGCVPPGVCAWLPAVKNIILGCTINGVVYITVVRYTMEDDLEQSYPPPSIHTHRLFFRTRSTPPPPPHPTPPPPYAMVPLCITGVLPFGRQF